MSIDYQRRNLKEKWALSLALKPQHISKWVVLSVAGILVSAGFGWHIWTQKVALSNPYRYAFPRPTRGSVTLALGREIAFYQTRLQSDPDSGLNRSLLAGTYLRMARATGDTSWYLLAERTAQESLAKLPFHNDGAIIVLARVATAKHDFAEALRLTQKVANHQDALPTIVTANLATGKLDAASQAATALVKRSPALNTLTLQALVQVAQGQDQAAIDSFRQAIAEEEPEETGSSVWARTLLGRLYFKRGQLDPARQLYQSALNVIPDYPPALLNLAELEVRMGNYRQAERNYSRFFITSQRSPAVYDHVVMRGMARVRELQGDAAGASQWREQAKARLRDDLATFGHRRELVRLLLERGTAEDLKEALSLMQTEVQVRRDAETLDTLAAVLSRLGRWQEARQMMQEALRSGIRDPALFDRASTIEQRLGNQAEARRFSQLVQNTDPTFDAGARRALGLGVGLLGLN